MSECWRFYAVPISFDIFSLSREQVWTFSVLGDRIYEPTEAAHPNEGGVESIYVCCTGGYHMYECNY